MLVTVSELSQNISDDLSDVKVIEVGNGQCKYGIVKEKIFGGRCLIEQEPVPGADLRNVSSRAETRITRLRLNIEKANRGKFLTNFACDFDFFPTDSNFEGQFCGSLLFFCCQTSNQDGA